MLEIAKNGFSILICTLMVVFYLNEIRRHWHEAYKRLLVLMRTPDAPHRLRRLAKVGALMAMFGAPVAYYSINALKVILLVA